MKTLLSRGIVAAMGTVMLTLGAGSAAAQSTQLLNTSYSLNPGAARTAAKPVAKVTTAPVISAVQRTITSTSNMFSSAVSSVFGTTDPRQAETARIFREATWLHNAGWPLYALVDRYSAGTALDEQATCLATAVYFEARGESLEGQLAVADVVMNRAASGQYPSTWCDVVKQPWQFSFVRHGRFPTINYDSDAWRKAQGVARLAMSNAIRSVPTNVLWYHADYVAPAWGGRLTEVSKIGAHIFYGA